MYTAALCVTAKRHGCLYSSKHSSIVLSEAQHQESSGWIYLLVSPQQIKDSDHDFFAASGSPCQREKAVGLLRRVVVSHVDAEYKNLDSARSFSQVGVSQI